MEVAILEKPAETRSVSSTLFREISRFVLSDRPFEKKREIREITDSPNARQNFYWHSCCHGDRACLYSCFTSQSRQDLRNKSRQ